MPVSIRLAPRLACSSCLALALAACGGGGAVAGGPFTGDPKNFTYDLDGTKVELKNGANEVKTGTGPDDIVATDLTQARLDADFDADGTTDCAVVITRDDGPVKVHYLALIFAGGRSKTEKLGTNVLVQNLAPDPKTGGIIVKLLTRDEGTPVETPPALPAEKRFKIKDGAIVSAK